MLVRLPCLPPLLAAAVFLLAASASAQLKPSTRVGMLNIAYPSLPVPDEVRLWASTPDGRFVVFSGKGIFASDSLGAYRQIYIKDTQNGICRRVSATPFGGISGDCDNADISNDGRYVTFTTSAPVLGFIDTNGTSDVYLKDTLTGEVQLVSHGPLASTAAGSSFEPDISGDGNFVAFVSNAAIGSGSVSVNPQVYLYSRVFDVFAHISRSAGGANANGPCEDPDVNYTGQYVVFESDATNLTGGDNGAFTDVFLRDVVNAATHRMSLDTGGSNPNGHCTNAKISGDGSRAVFVSTATDLNAADTNVRRDIYTYTRSSSAVNLVSTDQSGTVGDSYSYHPGINTDGTKIAFITAASNFGSGDNNGLEDTYRRNLSNGNYRRLSSLNITDCLAQENPALDIDGGFYVHDTNALSDNNNAPDIFLKTFGDTTIIYSVSTSYLYDGIARHPAVSFDGSIVAFQSTSTNLFGVNDTNGAEDVYVQQINPVQQYAASRRFLNLGNADSTKVDLSDDGQYFFFESMATNLSPVDTNGTSDIFVADSNGVLAIVSASSAGVLGNDGSYDVSCSRDGRYVAFSSDATNLVPGDTNGKRDVFVRDLQTLTTTRISVSSLGVQANGDSGNPDFARCAPIVVFDSLASNISPGDGNGERDIFLHNLDTGQTIRVSQRLNGEDANGDSRLPTCSDDGTVIGYETQATNLFGSDSNGVVKDVIVTSLRTFTHQRASISLAGIQANNSSTNATVSPDGSRVAFATNATNLHPQDTSSFLTLMVKELATGEVTPCNNDLYGRPTQSSTGALRAAFSGNGSVLVAESDDYDLEVNDEPGTKALLRTVAYPGIHSGNLLLQFYGGVDQLVEFSIEQGGQIVQVRYDNVSGSDPSYVFATDLSGPATVYVKASHWLRKAIPIDDLAESHVFNFHLINGDCDGDNEVAIGDYAILSIAYGLSVGDIGFDESADLNGDLSIDIADYAILSANYGEVGD
ncbi:MAG: hypothetical protein K1X67_18990 [Fimbriimonadaceae bacterium]|nr:hypothetical protein [Fimbriimonadaceae bacterium]